MVFEFHKKFSGLTWGENDEVLSEELPSLF
jgi:hypothetical protein